MDEAVTYGNLDGFGRPSSEWGPYGMQVDLQVEGHEDDPLWFHRELWAPASIAGIDDLDERGLESLGLAVADGMLRHLHWVG